MRIYSILSLVLIICAFIGACNLIKLNKGFEVSEIFYLDVGIDEADSQTFELPVEFNVRFNGEVRSSAYVIEIIGENMKYRNGNDAGNILLLYMAEPPGSGKFKEQGVKFSVIDSITGSEIGVGRALIRK